MIERHDGVGVVVFHEERSGRPVSLVDDVANHALVRTLEIVPTVPHTACALLPRSLCDGMTYVEGLGEAGSGGADASWAIRFTTAFRIAVCRRARVRCQPRRGERCVDPRRRVARVAEPVTAELDASARDVRTGPPSAPRRPLDKLQLA